MKKATITGRNAAFIITRAAKAYLMRKKVKNDLMLKFGQQKTIIEKKLMPDSLNETTNSYRNELETKSSGSHHMMNSQQGQRQ